MEALLFRDSNDAVVEDVPRPTPEGDEILIKVDRVQLSVTECNLYEGVTSLIPSRCAVGSPTALHGCSATSSAGRSPRRASQ